MITATITRYFPKMREGKDGKPKFITGSEQHRRHILMKTLEMVRGDTFYELASYYRVKGRSSNAQLIDVVEHYKDVKWDGLKVLCMQMYLPEIDELELFHPSDLQKLRGI